MEKNTDARCHQKVFHRVLVNGRERAGIQGIYMCVVGTRRHHTTGAPARALSRPNSTSEAKHCSFG